MQKLGSSTILVTGGAGFIGSNFVRHVLSVYPKARIVCVDLLTYAGNPDNVKGLDPKRFTLVKADITNRTLMSKVFKKHMPEYIVHFAAESHVDRSIHGGAEAFSHTNVVGTTVLLDIARKNLPQLKKFVHVSTDEVYGTLALGSSKKFTENSPLAPNSPYAASKAASDLIARSFFQTYSFPVVITRCSNNYGPYQHPEKLIPYSISRLMQGKAVAVYGDGKHVRDWLHVEDHCTALVLAMTKGVPGEVYNVGGKNEVNNLTIAETLVRALKKGGNMIEFVKDRPGHDRRYAIDASKIRRELGWAPKHTFASSLSKTVVWYQENMVWLKRALKRSGTINTHI